MTRPEIGGLRRQGEVDEWWQSWIDHRVGAVWAGEIRVDVGESGILWTVDDRRVGDLPRLGHDQWAVGAGSVPCVDVEDNHVD